MNRLKELELQIEDLRSKLHYLIDNNFPKSEICNLSAKMDELIVEYFRLNDK